MVNLEFTKLACLLKKYINLHKKLKHNPNMYIDIHIIMHKRMKLTLNVYSKNILKIYLNKANKLYFLVEVLSI
jgi:hypothetical protein